MNDNGKALLEEIKYSYTSLQMNLYFEYYIEVDDNENKELQKLLKGDYDINLSNKKYRLRNDYIKYGLETSIKDELGLGILGSMAIFHSFSYITSNFNELLDKERDFATSINDLFISKGYDYDVFYSIIRLIRSVSIHGSLSKDYKLEAGDFSKWKEYQTKKGIQKLEMNINIVDKLHKLDLLIDIDKIVIGYKFSEIFDGYKMLMFIELCMNLINHYNEREIS